MKDFLELREASESYNSKKIKVFLEALIAECVSIAEQKLMTAVV
jgi:hypothetical protein